MVERRDVLRTVGTVAIGTTIAGCSGSQDSGEEEEADGEEAGSENSITEVDVGPEKRLRYDPEEVEISVGDTIRWTARSQGHNVTSHPDASPKCENPDGTEPFTSYEGDQHFAIMEVDETLEHEFTVAGEYVYVCTPHAGQGMVGTIIVNE